MKRKVSTVMEDSLFRRVKLEAARQDRTLSAILEEALTRYFDNSQAQRSPYRSVADTWGAMAVPSDVIRDIMEDDDDDDFYA